MSIKSIFSKENTEINTLKAQVSQLSKENGDLAKINASLRKENEEMATTLQTYAQAKIDAPLNKEAQEKEIQERAERLAVDIIASAHIPAPISVNCLPEKSEEEEMLSLSLEQKKERLRQMKNTKKQ